MFVAHIMKNTGGIQSDMFEPETDSQEEEEELLL